MDISVLFKIAAIGIIITVICQILKKSDNTEKKGDLGHRQRLRKRFCMNGFEGMLKYEVLEMLLTLVILQLKLVYSIYLQQLLYLQLMLMRL